ncbi:unnamed protein product [Thlaspi arvense]|uniref:Uncharacterized protein n=1 Tax=Thlaspi arvense TaxID=13288 RepID=A0AAU9REE8_THLAR|nr:unnamed protein product [Thlaspi arvense]
MLCYRSSPADGEVSSSTSTDQHARMTTISPSVNRSHAPLSSELRRIDGTRRWQPSLSAISEDASTVSAGERERRMTNASLEKSVDIKTASFARRETTLKKAWRNTITYRPASPGFVSSPFM